MYQTAYKKVMSHLVLSNLISVKTVTVQSLGGTICSYLGVSAWLGKEAGKQGHGGGDAALWGSQLQHCCQLHLCFISVYTAQKAFNFLSIT